MYGAHWFSSTAPAFKREVSDIPDYTCITESMSPSLSIDILASPSNSIDAGMSPSHSIDAGMSPSHSIDAGMRPRLSLDSPGSQSVANLDELFDKFKAQRLEERRSRYLGVIKLGWILGSLGIFCYGVAYLLSLSILPMLVYISIAFVCVLVAASGVILLSTVPLDDLDLDSMAATSYFVRPITFSLTFLMSAILTGFPVYTACFLVVNSVFILLGYPSFTSAVSFYLLLFMNGVWPLLLRAAAYSSDPNVGVLYGRPFTGDLASTDLKPMWLITGYYVLIAEIIFVIIWQYRRNKFYLRAHDKTLRVYGALYGWLTVMSTALIVQCVCITSIYKISPEKRLSLYVGISLSVPLLIIFIFGRDRVFNFAARQFDLDPKRLEQDGAFIAGILDTEFIETGMSWYVHRDTEDLNYSETDKNRHWVEGRIVEITDTQFRVVAPISEVWLERGLKCENLLEGAKKNLRCIEWTNFTRDLMDGSIRVTGADFTRLYQKSRSLLPGERIDFFISHSWHDDGNSKFDELEKLSEQFRREKGRYPRFWFDKCCIDQNNIKDGLKALPINIMACQSMLLLGGSTYPDRLWCVWELCTLFSFMNEADALKRVVLLPLKGGDDVVSRLESFSLQNAHAYDPNEELRLLRVIAAVGNERFEKNIRALAIKIASKSTESAISDKLMQLLSYDPRGPKKM